MLDKELGNWKDFIEAMLRNQQQPVPVSA
ncbi:MULTISPECIES: protein YpfM [Sodalis]|nr:MULTISPECIES: protein YpfM [Sodalis]